MTYRAKVYYKGNVARNYDKERFSSWKGKLYDWFEKRSIKRALQNFPQKMTVLDVPCGTGRITEYVRKLGYNVSGADISTDMLKVATNKSNIDYYMKDIMNLNFPKDMFDIITCVRLMGHLPLSQKILALKNIRAVSRYSIITFYFEKKKLNHWYTTNDRELKFMFFMNRIKVLEKYPVCPGWSDGITYLLSHE